MQITTDCNELDLVETSTPQLQVDAASLEYQLLQWAQASEYNVYFQCPTCRHFTFDGVKCPCGFALDAEIIWDIITDIKVELLRRDLKQNNERN